MLIRAALEVLSASSREPFPIILLSGANWLLAAEPHPRVLPCVSFTFHPQVSGFDGRSGEFAESVSQIEIVHSIFGCRYYKTADIEFLLCDAILVTSCSLSVCCN